MFCVQISYKMILTTTTFVQTFFMLCIILKCATFSHSLRLDKDGAYHVSVVIDDTSQPDSVQAYLENMKVSFQRLSHALRDSTSSKFFIKSVNITVPHHWNVNTEEIPSIHFYNEADVKVSRAFQTPNAMNPNPCQWAGEYIELPFSFFSAGLENEYGAIGRTLLILWARYRYGVWDEHGYPGDPVFPYFNQMYSGSEWKLTHCSDVPLRGDIFNLAGERCHLDEQGLYPPDKDCRMEFNETQDAATSLMSFHFVPSMRRFCDDKTHGKRAPTRQNLFCQYRSVMNVIENSEDWIHASDQLINHTYSPTEFRIFKSAKIPLIYFLLDNEESSASALILRGITENFKTIFNSFGSALAAVGTYPGHKNYEMISAVKEWTYLSPEEANEFVTSFEETMGASATEKVRDFGSAIMNAAELLKHKKHLFGSVLVLIKTGADAIDKLAYEDEVIASVKGQNISLFLLELPGGANNALHLQNFALQTNATYLAIRDETDVEEKMPQFVESILYALLNPPTSNKQYRVLFKGQLLPKSKIQLYTAGVTKLHFHIVPVETLESGSIPSIARRDPRSGRSNRVELHETYDWDDSDDEMKKRLVYSGVLANLRESKADIEEWRATVRCERLSPPRYCYAFMLVYGELGESNDHSTNNYRADEVTATVSTTAINNVVDFEKAKATSPVNTPFGIYVKLEHDGIPLNNETLGFIWINATIRLHDNTVFTTIPLLDDGLGVPDIIKNDGVFSGTFVPRTATDGLYKMSITVLYKHVDFVDPNPEPEPVSFSTVHNFERLVPKDQKLIGCGTDYLGCRTKSLDFSFEKVIELGNTIEFLNRNSYQTTPFRIMDFKITALDNFEGVMEWTAPAMYSPNLGIVKSQEYDIRLKEDFDSFATSFESGEPYAIRNPNDPGTRESFSFKFDTERILYFGIRSLSTPQYGPFSSASNIVGVHLRKFVPTTTTPEPPTSSTEIPTTTDDETTTSSPSSSTASATPESTTTTTRRPPPTTPTTTPTTTTSKGPETSTLSTQPTTTEEPSKNWIQRPVGYISLSVFGGGLLIVIISTVIYLYFVNRPRIASNTV